MKKSFWFLSFVLILVFVVQLAPVVGTASGRTVTVGSVTAQGGATVEVPIVLSGNTGICGATFSVQYDSRLTLNNVESGEALSKLMFTEASLIILQRQPQRLKNLQQRMQFPDGIGWFVPVQYMCLQL